jgi:peptide/nickel transport system permease protein
MSNTKMENMVSFDSYVKKLFNFYNFLLTIVSTLLGLSLITFFIGRVMPNDPVLAIVGDRASQDVYETVRLELGLDKPIIEQYAIFISKSLQGDFGQSIMTTRPVMEDIKRFFPATLELATIATIMGILLGIPMGVYAAVHQGQWIDHAVRIFGLLGHSIPIFWLGMVSLLVFYAKLDWVPGPGRMDFYFEGTVDTVTGILLIDSAIVGEWEVFNNALGHIILPATMLSTFSLAYISRMTRSFMLDQLHQEYVTTARVKGLSEWRVIWQHAFRNILVQLITIIGLTYAALLEGSVLTETIFAWPGIGQYITNSLFNADMNAVIGGTMVIGVCFVGINLLSDLLYRFVDPRAEK